MMPADPSETKFSYTLKLLDFISHAAARKYRSNRGVEPKVIKMATLGKKEKGFGRATVYNYYVFQL